MKRTTRLVIIFMIFQISFPGETIHAITFIPKFIEHYNHHNEKHHPLSLLEFVGEHFTDNQHVEHKHHEQDNCPVNHNHIVINFTYILHKNFQLEIDDFEGVYCTSGDYFPPYQFSNSEFNYSIWQPPKIIQTS